MRLGVEIWLVVRSVKLEVCPKTKHKGRKSDRGHQAFHRFGHSDLLHAANCPLQLLQREMGLQVFCFCKTVK